MLAMDGTITITNISVVANEDTNDATATICYEWELPKLPSSIYFMVRKSAEGESWHEVAIPGNPEMNGNNCAEIAELVSGSDYEVYVEAELIDGDKIATELMSFTTPTIPQNQNYTCENLDYLVELICQAVTALYDGVKDIYANDCTKERCDPESLTPTTLTLWSRALRFFHATKCLACDMGAINLPGGEENQYFVGGDTKWTSILEQVLPPTDEESWKLVQSGTIEEYIAEKITEVWHFSGNLDYILSDLTNIPDDAADILNLRDDKVYSKVDGSWVVSTTIPQPTNFGAYSIKNASDTTELGKVKAGDVYYYFEGTWNLLNLNTDWVEETLNQINEVKDRVVQTLEEGKVKLYVASQSDFECDNYPDGERSIIFITEESPTIPQVMNMTIHDRAYASAPPMHQYAFAGRLAQEPVHPRCKNGYFSGWQDLNDDPFDFDMPLVDNTTHNCLVVNTCVGTESVLEPYPIMDTRPIGVFTWGEGKRNFTFTVTTAENKTMVLRAGNTPNGNEIAEKQTSGTEHVLTVTNYTHEFDPSYPPILYLQALCKQDDGGYSMLDSYYDSSQIFYNPILGIIKPPCPQNTGLNIVDIIEKKIDGTCTPRWQGGKRIIRKKRCGDIGFLLQENGSYLLQENGGKIIIEE